jgi:hypothetical protein
MLLMAHFVVAGKSGAGSRLVYDGKRAMKYQYHHSL